jgi:transposase-like protein
MTGRQGVRYSPAIRAQVLAAILAGKSIGESARLAGVTPMTASRWVRQDVRIVTAREARDRQEQSLVSHILGLAVDNIEATRAQLRHASDPEWLQQQTAAQMARLHAAESDMLIRLLAGLRPVGDQD